MLAARCQQELSVTFDSHIYQHFFKRHVLSLPRDGMVTSHLAVFSRKGRSTFRKMRALNAVLWQRRLGLCEYGASVGVLDAQLDFVAN